MRSLEPLKIVTFSSKIFLQGYMSPRLQSCKFPKRFLFSWRYVLKLRPAYIPFDLNFCHLGRIAASPLGVELFRNLSIERALVPQLKPFQEVKKENSLVKVAEMGYNNKKKRKAGWWEKRKAKSDNQEKDKRRNVRKWNETEILPPHPGSFATREMRTMFGYPDVLEDILDAPTDGESQPEDAQKETQSATDKGEDDEEIPSSNSQKAPKRKLAFLVGFLGQQYSGFQINGGQRTIQAELEYAMYKSGLLERCNFGQPSKYGWTTSARTDKGVHACAQVCGAKLRFDGSLDHVREQINDQLPADIRILDVKKVPRAFNAKNARNKVRYQYMIPSFLLQDRTTLKETLYRHAPNSNPDNREWRKTALSAEESSLIYNSFKDYRATKEQISKLRESLKVYEGTHSYHNYTRGKSFEEGSSTRFVLSFYASDPVISEHDGMEWIPTHVVGQSFLLNQIRKMISMAVDVARGAATIKAMDDSFTGRLMRVNICPAQGLFLEMSYYEYFNDRQNPNNNADDLDWSSENADQIAVSRWRNFKENQIMPRIMQEESSQYNFINYIYIHESKFNFKKYLPRDVASGTNVNNSNQDINEEDVLDESSGAESDNDGPDPEESGNNDEAEKI